MTPQEFGELIRSHRETKGVALEDLAMRFKLSNSTLRAIEEGRLENLPHAVYARGFVRSYAQAVGVSPEDLETGIEALFPQHVFEDVPTVPGPISGMNATPGRRSGDKLVSIFLALIFIGLPIGGGWFIVSNYGDDIWELLKKPFTASTVVAPAPDADTDFPAGEDATQPVAENTPPESGAVVENTGENAAPAGTVDESAPAQGDAATPQEGALPVSETPATAAPAVSDATIAPVDGKVVVITARRACWMQITTDGKTAPSFTLEAGKNVALSYKSKISIVLGNVGGVALTHNGKPYALTGKERERRTVVFQ